MKRRIAQFISLLLALVLCTSCDYETRHSQITNVNIFRDTPVWSLARAVKRQDVNAIRRITARNPELLDYQEPYLGISLLTWAIGMERYWSAKALLEAGADPNVISRHVGGTALYLAAGPPFIDYGANADPQYINLLLQYGADPNIVFIGNQYDKEVGTSPLMEAMICGMDKVRALVEAGADINYQTPSGNSALRRALNAGSPTYSIGDMEYAYYFIVERKASVGEPYYINGMEVYHVEALRDWIPYLDSEAHRMKMEVVEEFARQGFDYWTTEPSSHRLVQIKRLYPDTWEEYLEKY